MWGGCVGHCTLKLQGSKVDEEWDELVCVMPHCIQQKQCALWTNVKWKVCWNRSHNNVCLVRTTFPREALFCVRTASVGPPHCHPCPLLWQRIMQCCKVSTFDLPTSTGSPIWSIWATFEPQWSWCNVTDLFHQHSKSRNYKSFPFWYVYGISDLCILLFFLS